MGLARAQVQLHIRHFRADIDGKVTHAMLNHAHGPAAITPNGCPAPICRTTHRGLRAAPGSQGSGRPARGT